MSNPPTPLTPEQREKIKRDLLFVPCDSKEHLHRWIKVYLGLDLPNTIVCDDDVTNPPSNSCPMDLVWEVYSKAREGTDENFQKILAYACRGGYKTVACSVLEILSILHLNRNVGHAAALESQATICQKYIAVYFKRPYLRDFLTSKNKREIEVTRYVHTTQKTITQSDWEDLPLAEQVQYSCKINWIKILICTMGGMNGIHCPMVFLDELDLVNPGPLQEANGIPSAGDNGELPIIFYTSTRKFSFGQVQKAIDNAHSNGLVIRHWNIIDITEACKPERHRPDEPKIPIYYNESDLRSIKKEEWALFDTEEQKKWSVKEGYAGCGSCSLFSTCLGRLATKQKSQSKLLLSIPFVKSKMMDNPEYVKAQLMAWKPSSEGLIYPNFSRERHTLTAAAMAEKITGELPLSGFNKAHLVQLMVARGMSFHLGMDFGFSHNFATVLGALDGNRLFIIDTMAVKGLELTEKIEICKSRYFPFNPTVYPDNAYPADIKTFRRNGFRCKDFNKDVLGGIDAVRTKLMPGLNKDPEMFFLKDDSGVEGLVGELSKYHWVIESSSEKATEIPDSEDDDRSDALRYICQNLFGVRTKFTAALGSAGMEANRPTTQNWLENKVRQLTGGSGTSTIRGKRGGFFFNS